MTFKEISSKITGISFPIFGISWTASKPDIEIAKKVINFLEDKRVLYNAYQLEDPNHCYKSVIEIRQFLTEQLTDVKNGSEINQIIRGMRASCRAVLDNATPYISVHAIASKSFT